MGRVEPRRKVRKPRNFSWLIEDEIAGLGRPGGFVFAGSEGDDASLEDDLTFLMDLGVRALVSLTEEPLAENVVRRFPIAYLHIPIADMAPPTMEQVHRFIEFIEQAEQEGRPAAAHCDAGQGRTGTMLACYLVWKGYTTADAVNLVRRKRPGSIETADQELSVFDYECVLRDEAGG